MSKKQRIIIELILGAILIAVLYSWPNKQADAESGTRVIMGTVARIIAVSPDSNTSNSCVEAGFAEIEKVDRLLSDYKSDSEIGELNREGFNRAVIISKPTFEVLQKSGEFSKLSDGAFDVTVGPLADLWHKAGEANRLPTYDELAVARSKVGFEKLILDANKMSVRFAVEGMRVDLGAIAQGYAVDRAVEAMQKMGAIGGMVDLGGNIKCFGISLRGKREWLIGVHDHAMTGDNVTASEPLLTLKLADMSVATSGDYHRFIIIDAKSGRSSKELASVTVITASATDAEALGTAAAVMGLEKGIAMIKKMAGTDAILVTSSPEYKIIKTGGAEKYIK